MLRYGFFALDFEGIAETLNAYVPASPVEKGRARHLSVWFTDSTTGTETYEVGRYVDIGPEHPDTKHVYNIILNNAYNPYCAYSPRYTCAIPRKEDHLSFAVRAGELPYHL